MTDQKPESLDLADLDSIPWHDYVTKPVHIQAVQVGTDIKIDGIPDGDFIIKNPDPIEEHFGGVLHCPREDFLEHYAEVQ